MVWREFGMSVSNHCQHFGDGQFTFYSSALGGASSSSRARCLRAAPAASLRSQLYLRSFWAQKIWLLKYQ